MHSPSFWIDHVLRIFAGLLTPTIAAIAAYIAWKQWKTAHEQAETNRRQARLALFDKRLSVFNNTTRLLREIVGDAGVNTEQLYRFAAETEQHQFLFGTDIAQYLDELWKKGVELYGHVTKNEQFQRRTELLVWFHDQLKVTTEKFKPYMNFPEP